MGNAAPTADGKVRRLPIAEACSGLHVKATRVSKGAIEVNRGAFAEVFAYPRSLDEAVLEDGTSILLEDLVIKVGRYHTPEEFEAELKMARRAAAAGLAPRVLFGQLEPVEPAADGTRSKILHGTIVMERLTTPTLLRWLFWVSQDYQRKKGVAKPRWEIVPAALKLPIVRVWTTEVDRMQKALIKAGIHHGDWHERNIVFDVPAVRALTVRGDDFEDVVHDRVKEAIMKAIAAGPSAGRARIMLIDFAGATEIRTQLGTRTAMLCVNRHLADPSEERRSPTRSQRVSKQGSAMKRLFPTPKTLSRISTQMLSEAAMMEARRASLAQTY